LVQKEASAKKGQGMRSVKVAELQNRLSKYLTICQSRRRGGDSRPEPSGGQTGSVHWGRRFRTGVVAGGGGENAFAADSAGREEAIEDSNGQREGNKAIQAVAGELGEQTTCILCWQGRRHTGDPNATVRLLDTGHFALETHVAEIAEAMHEVLGGWRGRRTPATRQEFGLADRLGRRV